MQKSSISIEMENRNCPLCDRSNGGIIYSECGFNICKCNDCENMYMNPFPTASGFQRIYNDRYKFSAEDIDRVVKGFEEGKRFNDKLKLHGLTPVDSRPSLRLCENRAEAEFIPLSIPTLTGGEFREGGLNLIKKHRESGRLLDAGCNYGIFLRLVRGGWL